MPDILNKFHNEFLLNPNVSLNNMMWILEPKKELLFVNHSNMSNVTVTMEDIAFEKGPKPIDVVEDCTDARLTSETPCRKDINPNI